MDLNHKLKLFNTLSKQKEEFTPIKPGQVSLYLCGPTVYDRATIGNFRTYIFGDVLRRVLTYNNYTVIYVQNITDVGHLTDEENDEGEDKLAASAEKHGKSAWDVADSFIKLYQDDSQKLNITKPTITCRATDHIDDQIEMIKKLEKGGFTYYTSDGIYFNTSKQKDYGKLAKLDIDGLKEGARVNKNPEKKNLTDFALWKFSPNPQTGKAKRQMEWPSPFGIGFPGWHIECSAMSIKYLGEPFDIHGGGVDLIPIHHTNEIAQNEALYGHKTVNYWLHGGFIMVENSRMGKSVGNAYTIEDIITRGFDPLSFRYLTFTAHYRQSLNFTWEALEQANVAYQKLWHTVTALYPFYQNHSLEFNKEWNNKFLEAINDDLNMPKAIAIVWNMIKSLTNSREVLETLLKFDEVLGLSLRKKVEDVYLVMQEPETKKMVHERKEARDKKDWAVGDELRDKLQRRLQRLGYEIKDL